MHYVVQSQCTNADIIKRVMLTHTGRQYQRVPATSASFSPQLEFHLRTLPMLVFSCIRVQLSHAGFGLDGLSPHKGVSRKFFIEEYFVVRLGLNERSTPAIMCIVRVHSTGKAISQSSYRAFVNSDVTVTVS